MVAAAFPSPTFMPHTGSLWPFEKKPMRGHGLREVLTLPVAVAFKSIPDDCPAMAALTRTEAPDHLIRSHRLALAAFILLILSLPFAWWVVKHGAMEPVVHTRHEVRLFQGTEPVATHSLTIATGVLVLAVAVLLAVRLAAHSWSYEPKSWRRDLWLGVLLLLVAFATLAWWPDDVASFWGRQTFDPAPGSTGPSNFEEARPALGAWLAASSLGFLVAAAVASPPRKAETPE